MCVYVSLGNDVLSIHHYSELGLAKRMTCTFTCIYMCGVCVCIYSQRWSRVWSSEGTPHLKLCYPLLSQCVVGDGGDGCGGGLNFSRAMVDVVDIRPPPSLPSHQLLLVQVCDSFAVSLNG